MHSILQVFRTFRQPLLPPLIRSPASRIKPFLPLALFGTMAAAWAWPLPPIAFPAAQAHPEAGWALGHPLAKAATAHSPVLQVSLWPPVLPPVDRQHLLSQRIVARYRLDAGDALHIVRSAHRAGERYAVDPVLLLAISAVESSFNPAAVSPAGAVGLVQAMPRAHPEKFARLHAMGKDPMEASTSLDLGGQIYAEYRDRFRGDQAMALQQYNGSLRDPRRRYSSKVMSAYAFLSFGLPPASTVQ